MDNQLLSDKAKIIVRDYKSRLRLNKAIQETKRTGGPVQFEVSNEVKRKLENMQMNNAANQTRLVLLAIISVLWISIGVAFLTTKASTEPAKQELTEPQAVTDTVTVLPEIIVKPKKVQISYDKVWKSILKAKIKEPKWVMAQSILESGHYKSNYSKINNNIFGFELNGVNMHFPSIDSCVSYYKKWQSKRYEPSNHRSYADFLNRMPCKTKYGIYYARYAADTNYTDKVESVVNWIDKNENLLASN